MLIWYHSLLTLLHRVEYGVIRERQHLFCILLVTQRKGNLCKNMTDAFLGVTEIYMNLNLPLQSVMKHMTVELQHMMGALMPRTFTVWSLHISGLSMSKWFNYKSLWNSQGITNSDMNVFCLYFPIHASRPIRILTNNFYKTFHCSFVQIPRHPNS